MSSDVCLDAKRNNESVKNKKKEKRWGGGSEQRAFFFFFGFNQRGPGPFFQRLRPHTSCAEQSPAEA